MSEEIKLLKKVKGVLDILPFLEDNHKVMDYLEMNDWLNNVIKFYHQCGVELTYNDFKDLFIDNKGMNDIVNKYMKVFFENSNDLYNDVFRRTIFEVNADSERHIMDEIKAAVMKINNKSIPIFDKVFNEINKDISVLGMGKVDFNNVFEVKRKIDKRLNNLVDNEDKYDRFMILLTNGDYNNFDDKQKVAIFNDIDGIVDIIKRLRIFYELKDAYKEYSKNGNYDNMLKQIALLELKISELYEDVEVEKIIKLQLEKKNKNKEAKNKQIEILNLQKGIVLYDKEINRIKVDYINGFYHKYDILNELSELGMLPQRNDMLLGVFDVKKLPLDSKVVNEMDLFSKYNIKVPDIGSLEFKELSEIAFSLMKNKKSEKNR